MAKKKRGTINDERLRLYLLNMECVRRNPKYRMQYQELKKIKNELELRMKSNMLVSDWGLNKIEDLPNPEKRPALERLRRKKARSEIYIPGDLYIDPRISYANSTVGIDILKFLNDEKRNALKGTLLLVYIPEEQGPPSVTAINTRWAKKDIEESLLSWADEFVSRRKKHGLSQEYQKTRLRVDQGFEYLKVYDLREKGKSFGAVANILWGDKAGDTRKQASLYYQKAKRLIDTPPILQTLKEQLEERKQAKRMQASKSE